MKRKPRQYKYLNRYDKVIIKDENLGGYVENIVEDRYRIKTYSDGYRWCSRWDIELESEVDKESSEKNERETELSEEVKNFLKFM